VSYVSISFSGVLAVFLKTIAWKNHKSISVFCFTFLDAFVQCKVTFFVPLLGFPEEKKTFVLGVIH
jgi:hypothetical protein